MEKATRSTAASMVVRGVAEAAAAASRTTWTCAVTVTGWSTLSSSDGSSLEVNACVQSLCQYTATRVKASRL